MRKKGSCNKYSNIDGRVKNRRFELRCSDALREKLETLKKSKNSSVKGKSYAYIIELCLDEYVSNRFNHMGLYELLDNANDI